MAELNRHTRHLYFCIESETVYSVYHTIRGNRVMEVAQVPGLPDKDRLNDNDIIEVEKIVV